MKFLRPLGLLITVLAALVAVGSVGVEKSFEGRAQLIQRIEKDDAADLFGEAGTPVGAPQRLIIDDPKAFLPGKTEEGAKMVDEKYLQANHVYPLQIKTVSYVAGLVRMGALAALALGILLLLFARSRVKTSTS